MHSCQAGRLIAALLLLREGLTVPGAMEHLPRGRPPGPSDPDSRPEGGRPVRQILTAAPREAARSVRSCLRVTAP
eukprot:494580-Prorocentrum_minimum.AAC.1